MHFILPGEKGAEKVALVSGSVTRRIRQEEYRWLFDSIRDALRRAYKNGAPIPDYLITDGALEIQNAFEKAFFVDGAVSVLCYIHMFECHKRHLEEKYCSSRKKKMSDNERNLWRLYWDLRSLCISYVKQGNLKTLEDKWLPLYLRFWNRYSITYGKQVLSTWKHIKRQIILCAFLGPEFNAMLNNLAESANRGMKRFLQNIWFVTYIDAGLYMLQKNVNLRLELFSLLAGLDCRLKKKVAPEVLEKIMYAEPLRSRVKQFILKTNNKQLLLKYQSSITTELIKRSPDVDHIFTPWCRDQRSVNSPGLPEDLRAQIIEDKRFYLSRGEVEGDLVAPTNELLRYRRGNQVAGNSSVFGFGRAGLESGIVCALQKKRRGKYTFMHCRCSMFEREYLCPHVLYAAYVLCCNNPSFVLNLLARLRKAVVDRYKPTKLMFLNMEGVTEKMGRKLGQSNRIAQRSRTDIEHAAIPRERAKFCHPWTGTMLPLSKRFIALVETKDLLVMARDVGVLRTSVLSRPELEKQFIMGREQQFIHGEIELSEEVEEEGDEDELFDDTVQKLEILKAEEKDRILNLKRQEKKKKRDRSHDNDDDDEQGRDTKRQKTV